MKYYTLYSDGACSGNPGPGGRGVVVLENNKEIYRMNGSKQYTTNNEMELSAVLFGIQYICQTNNITKTKYNLYEDSLFSTKSVILASYDIVLSVYLDSQYVRQGVLEYMSDRKKRGRKTSRKKIIKNLELWQELDSYLGLFSIQRHRVKGHNGDTYNEIADYLASSAIVV